MTSALAEDVISNQQGFQDMKSRLHRMLINRMDLTKLGQLEPEQLHEEVARLASSLLAQEDTPLSTVERERLIHEVRHELFGLVGMATGRRARRGIGRPLRTSMPRLNSTMSPGRPITRFTRSACSEGKWKTTTSPRAGKCPRTRPEKDGTLQGKLKRE